MPVREKSPISCLTCNRSLQSETTIRYMPVTRTANLVVRSVMGTYYQHAKQRQPSRPSGVNPTARPLHFFRGMVHFEPGESFLQSVTGGAFAIRIFRYSPTVEDNRLTQWPEKTGEVIRHLIDRPEDIGERPVFVGHSAGGFTTYVLAALARGARVSAVKDYVPQLDDVPPSAIRELAYNLSGATFVSIASPLNGLRFTRAGAVVSGAVTVLYPSLLKSLNYRYLSRFYNQMGFRPDQVMDGVIVSREASHPESYDLRSRAVNSLVLGGLRCCSPFLKDEGASDGIVPVSTALLKGPLQHNLDLNHLELVESHAGGEALVTLLDQIARENKREISRSHVTLRRDSYPPEASISSKKG